ncbi:hypothetical protein [Pseudoflavonifractor sp. MSJ-37]|uniref:hypothetical protein n=1 Tax=Pseudoflavonifractor sp. MSJ-37 TaxID=2841531 RepID=UPI001C11A30C|nr:hypothetical protein [Pseudoflavonifractor sp. MSJ-37]MBU5436026.1 hypothetical protein [Pseudoflavonifractor sp. MSJ-37]
MALDLSAFAASRHIGDAMKAEYHAEYIQIAREVSKETGIDVSVLPMDEFSDEDWRTPDEFRAFITEIANSKIVCDGSYDGPQPYSRDYTTKTASVEAEGLKYTISITGSFVTQLNSSTHRQHFDSITSITSRSTSSTATWTQTGYTGKMMDAARTYAITVSGRLKVGGALFSNKLAYVEFYCNSTGEIS